MPPPPLLLLRRADIAASMFVDVLFGVVFSLIAMPIVFDAVHFVQLLYYSKNQYGRISVRRKRKRRRNNNNNECSILTWTCPDFYDDLDLDLDDVDDYDDDG